MKNKVKYFLIGFIALSLGMLSPKMVHTKADEEFNTDNDIFIGLDEDGGVTQIPLNDIEKPNLETLKELQDIEYQIVQEIDGKKEVIETVNSQEEADKVISQMKKKRSYNVGTVESIVNINTSNGVVIFGNVGKTTDYINENTGVSGYLATDYGPDAAYLGMKDGKVRFKFGGVTGLVPSDQVYVVDYDAFVSKGLKTSVYTTTQGKLYHKITTNLVGYQSTNLVGYQQSYMTNNATYYSYDGHYFYTNYKTMLGDYKANSHANAINPNNPYYNYYQYLSHRSTTGFSATQMNQYINANTTGGSKLRNLGNAFIENQNTYGANAILMLGVAVNESAWGNSSIAKNKNNLFGHGAVDSNPYWGANGYASPSDSVKYHAQMFLSNGYLDVVDWRYFGPHLGDKESGANVKYASDPYWGEKAAARGYYIEDYFSDKTYDYGKYKVGVTSGNTSVYQNPNTSKEQYSTGNASARGYRTDNVSVVILDTVSGQSINGNSTWYKVQTDTPLKEDRSKYLRDAQYSFTRDYGYIHSSAVSIINTEQGTTPTYLRGDVNGDGARSAVDYMLIKNHILNRNVLGGTQLSIADVNRDGSVTASDYMLIKNHILGRTNLDN